MPFVCPVFRGAVHAVLPVLALWCPPSLAEPVVIKAEAQTEAANCLGDAARVEGNRNTLTISGSCRSLDVRGDANRITIELRPGASVHVEGQQNRIGYSVVGGTGTPNVSVAGVDSSVVPASELPPPQPVPGPGPAVPSGQPQQQFTGVTPAPSAPPPAPSPAGPPAAAPAPRPASAQAAPSPAPTPAPIPPLAAPTGLVVLRGNDQQREADCSGVPAVIEGDRGSIVLRGGCTSLTVRGHLTTVQAELAPRATVLIEGTSDTVFWAPARPGNPPAFVVRGEGSAANRVARIPR